MSEFSSETRLNFSDIESLYKKGKERFLADGSVLTETDNEEHYIYVRKYPNGKIAEYRLDEDESELLLIKEETADGRVVVYDYKLEYDEDKDEDVYKQIKIYERDSSGHYVYNRYERDDYDDTISDFIETVEGNIYHEQEPQARITLDEIRTIYGNEKILADGSVLTENGDTYTRKYTSGRIAEYRLDEDEGELLLIKEEMPDGKLVIYDYKLEYDEDKDEDVYKQIKIYERDSSGHYVYNRYERDDYDNTIGDFIETVKGDINHEQKPQAQVVLGELEVIYEKDHEKILADGSVFIEEGEDVYTRKYLSGKIAKYRFNYNEDELLLTQEVTPDGRFVVYGYKDEYNQKTGENEYTQVKIYERDSSGHYVYNRYKKENTYDDEVGDFIETLEGNINQEQEPSMRTNFGEIGIVYENDGEMILADGSILTENADAYTRKYASGKIVEYRLDEDELFLIKEEMPDGRLVIYDYKIQYDEDKKEYIYTQIKLHERDAAGHFVSYRYEVDDYDNEIGHLLEKTEGNHAKWIKKTFYDEDESPIFYKKEADETRKYYLSGELMEEDKGEDGIFCYYESGVCKSEEYPNGVVKRYAENGLLLYESDEEGNYQKFKLNSFGNGTLLIEKGDDYGFNERYKYDEKDNLLEEEQETAKGIHFRSYYPGKERQIKEERLPDGTITMWSENNKKTYEKRPDKSYIKYTNSGRYYQRFDKNNKLIEETNVFGKMTYTYYPNSKQVEHIHKYNESGNEIVSAYKHFDKQGKDNTKYYLARKKIIERRLNQEDKKAQIKGIDRIKAIKKRSKIHKIIKVFEHFQAIREIKEK